MQLAELLEHTTVLLRPVGEVDRIAKSGRTADDGCLVCLCGASAEDEAEVAYSRGARIFLCDRFLPLPADCTVLVSQSFSMDYDRIAKNFYHRPDERLTRIAVTGDGDTLAVAGLLARMADRHGMPAVLIAADGYQMGNQRTMHVDPPVGDRELYHAMWDGVRNGCQIAILHLPPLLLKEDVAKHLSVNTTVIVGTDAHGEHLIEHTTDAVICPTEEAYRFTGKRTRTYGGDGALACKIEEKRSDGTLLSLSDGKSLTVRLMHDNAHRLCEIALLAGLELGISLREGQKILKETSALSSLEVIAEKKGALYLLDASYTPTDTERVLRTVREHTKGRLIVVIGCVGMRDNDRRTPIGRALEDYADRIYLTADNPGFESVSGICAEILSDVFDASKFTVLPQREDAIRAAATAARRGDAVLLLGKGYEPYQLIGSERIPYSERETLLRILNQA